MLSQLEKTNEGSENNQDGIKISEIDFNDLSPEIVNQAAPTIQYSISVISKDEVEEPARRSKCKNIA